MASAEERTWIVTLSGERPANAVANDLKAAGLDVSLILEAVNNVVASGADAAAAKARGIAGVAEVAPDQTVDIGPPGAPLS